MVFNPMGHFTFWISPSLSIVSVFAVCSRY